MSEELKALLAERNGEHTKAKGAASAAAVGHASAAQAPARPPLKLGGEVIPAHLETRHILPVGTTGSGKSQAIYQMLTTIRQRDEPAIIIDHSAEFLQRYYHQDVDLIFNPFDERGIGWSPFNEMRRIYDADRLAAAIVPDVPGENQDWQVGAQQLLANVMSGLWNMGERFCTNEALIYYTTKAPAHARFDEEGVELAHTLAYVCKDSTSSTLFDVGNEKQLAITRGILAKYMKPLSYLKEGSFSMTDYIKQFETVGACHSWLFLSYTDASYKAIRSLFSIMVSCGVQSALELSESATRRFYFVLDEFSSLDKIDAIDDALTKMRKRGGVVICGIQSTAQLTEKYGEVGAQTLLSCFGNVLMLRVADDQTAEKLSAMIGDQERWETSYNEGQSATGKTTGWSSGESKQKQIKRAVLASEFYALPDLVGWVRIAGKPEAVQTRVPVSNLPLVAKGEETRDTVALTR